MTNDQRDENVLIEKTMERVESLIEKPPPEARDSPMVEMFTLYPHESAIVMCRGIELGIICSCGLVLHCAWLLLQSSASTSTFDYILRCLCIARVVCAIPRPYYWFKTRTRFLEARFQPTPQLVTKQLLYIYASPFKVERVLFVFYYSWLFVATIILLLFRAQAPGFADQLWKHCCMNVASIFLHRVVCATLFYHLMHSKLDRGIPVEILDKYSQRMNYTEGVGRQLVNGDDAGELECSVCLGGYEHGQGIRRLRCGHHFHQNCVDAWLLGHQNRCPLCTQIVGPTAACSEHAETRSLLRRAGHRH